MKLILFLIPVLLFSVGCDTASKWQDVRPLQEMMISSSLKNEYFHGRTDIHVNTYVIPDKDNTPEVRLIIVGNFDVSNASKRKDLIREVESIVLAIRPYASDIPRDTSSIKIQLTGYNTERNVMEYFMHNWSVLDEKTTPEVLRKEARKLQRKTALQNGLE